MKFEDDLIQIADDERLAAIAPDLPIMDPIEEESKSFVVTVG